MDKHKAPVSIDLAKCPPCSRLICIGACPQGVLEQGADKKPVIIDVASCTLCGVCVDMCPTKAITLKRNESSK